uniref:Retrotransposon protein, putative, Ty3-gypsy sub-class n=1 Tax=Oryza sativa subsp. japonica TaxID=39947 RepID=Q75H39_ORYSJ|nr:hypothetical protein [Oryza sativa Japonica Group]AAV35816.1 retrotransposon protein, putative, Ty3-gypsy sub-class [Oryza sativa Japonica Group]
MSAAQREAGLPWTGTTRVVHRRSTGPTVRIGPRPIGRRGWRLGTARLGTKPAGRPWGATATGGGKRRRTVRKAAADGRSGGAAKDDDACAKGGGAHGREERKEERGFLTGEHGGRREGRRRQRRLASGGAATALAAAACGESALAAVKLTAAVTRCGGGCSSDGTRPESFGGGEAWRARRSDGRRHGGARRERKTREGDAGSNFIGTGGADVAGRVVDLAGDVGEWGDRGGGFKFESRPVRARAVGKAGRGRRRGCGRTWTRSGRGRSGGGGRGGFGGGGWRKGTTPTGGAHLSASRREREGEMGRPNKGSPSAG